MVRLADARRVIAAAEEKAQQIGQPMNNLMPDSPIDNHRPPAVGFVSD